MGGVKKMSDRQLLNKALRCAKRAKAIRTKSTDPQRKAIELWFKREELLDQAESYWMAAV